MRSKETGTLACLRIPKRLNYQVNEAAWKCAMILWLAMESPLNIMRLFWQKNGHGIEFPSRRSSFRSPAQWRRSYRSVTRYDDPLSSSSVVAFHYFYLTTILCCGNANWAHQNFGAQLSMQNGGVGSKRTAGRGIYICKTFEKPGAARLKKWQEAERTLAVDFCFISSALQLVPPEGQKILKARFVLSIIMSELQPEVSTYPHPHTVVSVHRELLTTSQIREEQSNVPRSLFPSLRLLLFCCTRHDRAQWWSRCCHQMAGRGTIN